MKFKAGQKVEVVKQLHGHEFEIGEIVKIERASSYDYFCANAKGEHWYLDDDELELADE